MTGTERFTAQSFETAAVAEQIRLVPPAMARPFQGHTFQIRDDTGMKRLMKSVAEHGILEPALAFYNEEGELELISGHRRQKVALSLGLEVMPVLIRNVSRDQATILMGETNLMQREKVLPSEKGFTYQAMLEAIRRLPGTGGENEADEAIRAKSRDILSKRIGESASQIQRFIRLIRLMPELLNLVDTDKLSMRTGLELTRLSTACQREVFRIYQESSVLPTYRLSRRLTEMTEQGALKEEQLQGLILEEDRDEAEEVEKMTFKSPIIMKLLSGYGSIKEREDRIIEGLKLLEQQEKEWQSPGDEQAKYVQPVESMPEKGEMIHESSFATEIENREVLPKITAIDAMEKATEENYRRPEDYLIPDQDKNQYAMVQDMPYPAVDTGQGYQDPQTEVLYQQGGQENGFPGNMYEWR